MCYYVSEILDSSLLSPMFMVIIFYLLHFSKCMIILFLVESYIFFLVL